MTLKSDKALVEPHLRELPARKMVVLHTHGDPDRLPDDALKPLFLAIQAIKHGRAVTGAEDFPVEPIRARWPVEPGTPRSDWVGLWGIPVPNDVNAVPTDDPDHHVEVESWEYGTVAEILHEGAYADEHRAIETLHRFIADEGYRVVGVHEEEYLTRPGAAVPKTLIRYPVEPV